MRARIVLPLLLSLIATAPCFGADQRVFIERGNVLLDMITHKPGRTPEQFSGDFFEYREGWAYAIFGGGSLLIYKDVPYYTAGHLFVPLPEQWVFEAGGWVSMWDGVYRDAFTTSGPGYDEIFYRDAWMGEIAPMRNGNFLIAEATRAPNGPKLIQFSHEGIVAEYPFPEVRDAQGQLVGAEHIELLGDQCTVLYTTGNDDPNGNRVRRLNICTRQPMTDFATLTAGQYAGAIRELPNGEVLVANGTGVHRFTAEGSLLRTYWLPNVTHIALTLNGSAFWAAGVDADVGRLQRLDAANPDPTAPLVRLGNPQASSAYTPFQVDDLVVVSEWRSSSPTRNPRVRALRPH